MIAATHDGSFHADEVFALAALQLAHPDLRIVRTRDRDELAAADLRVDVGFRYDPAAGDFDHHQRDFTETRPGGLRYASFGLIWREYGARICGDDETAEAIEATLVAPIDANDTGQELSRTLHEGIRPLTLSGLIGGFNARWDEQLSAEQERERLEQALDLARGILEREIASAASGRRAQGVVRAAITAASDPRLLELAENVPWKQVVVTEAPEALFVIYPKRQGYGLETVPRELGSFANRKDLPAEWAGREDAELEAVTGVPDVLFAHAKRFLAVARSHEAIERLAQLALTA